MSIKITCPEAEQHLKQIQALEQELSWYFDQLLSSTTAAQAKEYRTKAREIQDSLEETIMHALTALVEENEVIDDPVGNGHRVLSFGAFFPNKGIPASPFMRTFVPEMGFVRNQNLVNIGKFSAWSADEETSTRFGIRL